MSDSHEGGAVAPETRAVAVRGEDLDTNNPIVLGRLAAQSGLFADAQDAAKAFVKIQAGRELGIPAIASMTSIHVYGGKVTLGSNAVAALLKGSGKYDFRVLQSTADRCEIEFLRIRHGGGEVSIGTWDYSIKDAETAGLLGKDNWKHSPRDMCFARALIGGARKFCGDVILGVFDPDEVEESTRDTRLRRGAEAIERGRAKARETTIEAQVVETHEPITTGEDLDDEDIV